MLNECGLVSLPRKPQQNKLDSIFPETGVMFSPPFVVVRLGKLPAPASGISFSKFLTVKKVELGLSGDRQTSPALTATVNRRNDKVKAGHVVRVPRNKIPGGEGGRKASSNTGTAWRKCGQLLRRQNNEYP